MAAFIQVLVGRLLGAGLLFVAVGLLLALAPGHDGGDLRDRVDRMRAWIAENFSFGNEVTSVTFDE